MYHNGGIAIAKGQTKKLHIIIQCVFPHFLWLFPDHFAIPWSFQGFQVSGHPVYVFWSFALISEVTLVYGIHL